MSAAGNPTSRPRWYPCPGGAHRALIAGYAAYVKPMRGGRWAYGVTIANVDRRMVYGPARSRAEAKRRIGKAMRENFRPVGSDGLQAVRGSGVAHLLDPVQRRAQRSERRRTARAMELAGQAAQRINAIVRKAKGESAIAAAQTALLTLAREAPSPVIETALNAAVHAWSRRAEWAAK